MPSWFLKVFIFFAVPFASFGNSCFHFYQPKMYSKDSAYGLQAYKINIDRLRVHFQTAKELTDGNEVAKIFLSSDTRVLFFRLQSLSRVYEKAYDSSFFMEKKDFFKKFEDLIGKIDLNNGLVLVATKLKQPQLIKFFEEKKATAIQNLVDGLISEKFISPLDHEGPRIDPNEKLNSIYKELVEFEGWKEADKDLKLHFKRIAKEIRKLLEETEARKFTQDDIEKGLHELRRKLRWPLIHIQTLSRLTAFNKNAELPTDVQEYFDSMLAKNPEILTSSFLKMATPDIKHPAQVPFYAYAIFTEIVAEIGVQKDKAEADIYIAEAMQELKFAPRTVAKIEADLLKITGRTEKIDHKALADDYQSELESSGVLLYFAQQLEKLNDINP